MKIKNFRLLWLLLIFPVLAIACRAVIPGPESSLPASPSDFIPTVVPAIIDELQVPQVILDEQSLLIELYKRTNPSVVNLTIYNSIGNELMPLSQGSGFLIDNNGNILTNAHITNGAEQIEVGFYEGSLRDGTLVGQDLNSDLAIVKVDDLPAGVGPLPLGDIEDVLVGQTVVAIGNPFGLDGTLTRGIVSAVGRSIPALTPFSIPEAIQTDAPINPGNSGGPLLNLKGEVIGVNAQIETDGENRANSGVGFAIPISIVKRVAPELAQFGKYIWPWLGVRGTSLNSTISEAMDLNTEKGAYITDIISGGPAQQAGLHGSTENAKFNGRTIPIGGDIITAINGHPIESFDDLLIFVALQTSPGDTVNLTVLRNGQVQDIQLTLEPRPEELPEE